MSIPAKQITVRTLFTEKQEEWRLELLAGKAGLDSRLVVTSDINRPGLALAGYTGVFLRERIQIIGRGAHGASPNFSIDPVLTASEAIVALQQIVSRNLSPMEPGVLSICMINAGTAYNIIPEECAFRGTVRTLTKGLRNNMPRMIRRVVAGVAKAHGAKFEMEYLAGYDALVNDRRATGWVREMIADMFGGEALKELGPRMGAEDFSEYLKLARGCFFMLGTGNRRLGTDVSHHNPRFRVDESALWRGVAVMARLAVERARR